MKNTHARDKAVHNTVGGNEQSQQCCHQETKEKRHITFENLSRVPIKEIRCLVRHINSQQRPYYQNHARAEQRYGEHHQQHLETCCKEVHHTIEHSAHHATMLWAFGTFVNILHHFVGQISHIHGFALHFQLLFGCFGLGHNQRKNDVNPKEYQNDIHVEQDERVISAEETAQEREHEHNQNDGQPQLCGFNLETGGQTGNDSRKHLVLRIAVEATSLEEFLHRLYPLVTVWLMIR